MESTDEGTLDRLRRIESITDNALGHLTADELLVELVTRLRELLGVDTAAVLLLDQDSMELVATAAAGLEEEVRQGVRVPLGAGFAGRIGAEKSPVIIEDLDRADIWNPILRQIGIRSLLGVPLLADGQLVGVLHVGSLTTRRFDRHDVDLLRRVADRAALAITTERSNVERAAAAALQRSLVPGRLPTVPGLEIAARYLPGEQGGVGGDWYDVFPLPTGEVGFVIGDVVGRGFEAAIVMGRLRSALRAYALESLDPGEVLHRLDRKAQHFEAGQMTTAVYGVLSRTLGSVDLSNAGHLRPVLLLADGTRTVIDVATDPPLGLGPAVTRRTTTIDVPPGALLVLFTDGLVERRGVPIDDRLDQLVEALVAGSAGACCVGVVASMLSGSGATDDVALLVLRRREGAEPLRLVLPAVPRSLATVRTALRRWLPLVGVSDDRSVDVVLAIGEAVANVVGHAYGPAGGDVTVQTELVPDGWLAVTVSDAGQWRERRGTNRGRGLGIMEKCASDVDIEQTEHGTTVRLRFELDGELRKGQGETFG